MPFGLSVTDPLVGPVPRVKVSVSPFGSVSLPATEALRVVPAAVVPLSSTATGGPWTVTVTVAVSLPPLPSEAV